MNLSEALSKITSLILCRR